MSQIKYDEAELEQKLIRLCVEVWGYEQINAETPMHEIRARGELAGMMFGRAFAAALHTGPITAAIALDIKASEQLGKERFLRSVDRLYRPGGEVREIMEAKKPR
ncbi:hypothetical protein N7388_10210 [Stutzerimonas stutzeri]|uniref:hypothetical protein n=1 Tax=Stutzerimonas stutzeri TaxID=316 RepID=UPI00244A198E|nr:hypothetical protein [Stutzerimonas stutzeri]MDH0444045.1 hypothetical protein [Stutzerimonas stutzeri]